MNSFVYKLITWFISPKRIYSWCHRVVKHYEADLRKQQAEEQAFIKLKAINEMKDFLRKKPANYITVLEELNIKENILGYCMCFNHHKTNTRPHMEVQQHANI